MKNIEKIHPKSTYTRYTLHVRWKQITKLFNRKTFSYGKKKLFFNFLRIIFVHTAGYSYPVDWWSLGVVAYEMRAGIRPFIVHSSTPLEMVKSILNNTPHYPRHWSDNFTDLICKVNLFIYTYLHFYNTVQEIYYIYIKPNL